MRAWLQKHGLHLLPAPWQARRAAARRRAEAAAAHRALLEEMAECRRQLQQADSRFNLAGEPEMIESSIYHYRALQAQYDCLVRRARQEAAAAL